MSNFLQPTPRKDNNEQFKYSIDCNKIKEDPSTIKVINGDVRAKHTMIINAIVNSYENDSLINPNGGKIVVKIGKTNESIQQEYNVSKKLESIDGFIKMNCLFSCNNDINLENKTTDIDPNIFKICNPTDKQPVDVLIMPFIHTGQSLKTFLEKKQDPVKYKSILKKVITNIYEAFTKTGFTHKDLHFGNILIDENDEPIIMDFDTSEFSGFQGFFWGDLIRLFSDVLTTSILSDKIQYTFDYLSYIITMLTTASTDAAYVQLPKERLNQKVNEILTMIETTNINVIDNTNKPKSYKYNPNVFGGKKYKTRKSSK